MRINHVNCSVSCTSASINRGLNSCFSVGKINAHPDAINNTWDYQKCTDAFKISLFSAYVSFGISTVPLCWEGKKRGTLTYANLLPGIAKKVYFLQLGTLCVVPGFLAAAAY